MNEDIDAVAVSDTKPCINCGKTAEPERDGDYLYFVCTDWDNCGTEFGYTRVAVVNDDDTCQVGIPESVRRNMPSSPMSEEEALEFRRKAFVERITMGQPPQ